MKFSKAEKRYLIVLGRKYLHQLGSAEIVSLVARYINQHDLSLFNNAEVTKKDRSQDTRRCFLIGFSILCEVLGGRRELEEIVSRLGQGELEAEIAEWMTKVAMPVAKSSFAGGRGTVPDGDLVSPAADLEKQRILPRA